MNDKLVTFKKIKHIESLIISKGLFFLENPNFKKVNLQNIYVLQERIDYF